MKGFMMLVFLVIVGFTIWYAYVSYMEQKAANKAAKDDKDWERVKHNKRGRG